MKILSALYWLANTKLITRSICIALCVTASSLILLKIFGTEVSLTPGLAVLACLFPVVLLVVGVSVYVRIPSLEVGIVSQATRGVLYFHIWDRLGNFARAILKQLRTKL
ncbi:MAG TPA: hypothetical protein ACFYD3_07325 [Candidatus Hypogeohydataceae bacterium YC41]